MIKHISLLLFVSLLLAVPAHAAITRIVAGSHSWDNVIDSNTQNFQVFADTVFYPNWTNANPEFSVNVSGTVDMSNASDSALFVGLMSVDRYNAWQQWANDNPNDANDTAFGYLETAYLGFLPDKGDSGAVEMGQRHSSGETLQRGIANVGDNNGFEDWNARFSAEQLELSAIGEDDLLPFGTHVDYLAWAEDDFPGNTWAPFREDYPLETDWSSGAYAFVTTWFGGANRNEDDYASFDLTFHQTPEPGGIAALIGMTMVGFAALWRRRK